MRVIKRNGTEVSFDASKIRKAILGANNSTAATKRIVDVDQVVDRVIESIGDVNYTSVETIHDKVEEALMNFNYYDVAKNYILFREQKRNKKKFTEDEDKILAIRDNSSDSVKGDNSNKDPRKVPTQRDYIAGIECKTLARKMLPKDIIEAHDTGKIHFHDMDYSPVLRMTNCGLVNFKDMLENGFNLNSTHIHKPHSFRTACNLACQIFLHVSQSQYGGMTGSWAHIARYVQASREAFEKQYEIVEDPKLRAELIQQAVKEDIRQGVQTFQYQIVTLSGASQTPFSSMSLNFSECEDEQHREDLAMVIEEVLKQRYNGFTDSHGMNVSPIFPKLLYFLDEDTAPGEGGKYEYLTDLAIKCVAKRMAPDFISAKVQKATKHVNNSWACMGCVDGDSTIQVKVNGVEYVTTFEDFWNRLELDFRVTPQLGQPSNPNKQMILSNTAIWDNKEDRYVACPLIIRNVSTDWRLVLFTNKTTGEQKSLDVTHDHIFTLIDGTDKRAENLAVGDAIFGDYAVESISVHSEEKYSYDVTTSTAHFMVNGLYSHNCRSFLTVEGSYMDNGVEKRCDETFYGRHNNGVVTLNIPYVALESERNMEKFWKLLDERAELCYKALVERYKALKGTKACVAPILWMEGAYTRKKADDTIDDIITGFRSTYSLGYVGLWEAVYYMTGKTMIEEKGFALQVLKFLSDKCSEWHSRLMNPNDPNSFLNTSLYGTPEENFTDRAAKALQAKFGIIGGVTDHDYVTNSFHINPAYKIDAFDKLKFESEFVKYSVGGNISYVELPNMDHNLDALKTLVRYMYDNTLYSELNLRIDKCVCGYEGEMNLLRDENGKYYWKCPNCGTTDNTKMSILRRVCGYIGNVETGMSNGRLADIEARVLHL